MGARKARRRSAARQPGDDAEGKPVSDMVAIFALAYLRLRGAGSARAREVQNSRNTLAVSLDDRAPVGASCERVEQAAVNAGESDAVMEAMR